MKVFKAIVFILFLLIQIETAIADDRSGNFFFYVQFDDQGQIDSNFKIRISYNRYTPFHESVSNEFNLSGNEVKKFEIGNLDFQINSYRVLLEPGDTIQLIRDNNLRLIPDYKKGCGYAYISAWKNEVFLKMNSPAIQLENLSLTEGEYFEFCNKYLEKELEVVSKHIPANKPQLTQFLVNRAKHSFIFNYLLFTEHHTVDSATVYGRIGNDIDAFLVSPPALVDYMYRLSLNRCMQYATAGKTFSLPDSLMLQRQILYSKNHLNPNTLKEALLGGLEVCFRIGDFRNISTIDTIWSHLLKLEKDSLQLTVLQSFYRRGKLMSFNLNHYNRLNLQAFENSIKDYPPDVVIVAKGKVYLVDLWASWCLPCINELPSLKQLEEKYSNLEVISISIDTDSKKWKQAITKHKTEQFQHFIATKTTMTWLKDYLGDIAVPRYLLYDHNGKCITTNAARPNETALEKQIQAIQNSYIP